MGVFFTGALLARTLGVAQQVSHADARQPFHRGRVRRLDGPADGVGDAFAHRAALHAGRWTAEVRASADGLQHLIQPDQLRREQQPGSPGCAGPGWL